MTIGGALSELNNLLKADDIPCYYKSSIKAVMDTIVLEQEFSNNWIKCSDHLPDLDVDVLGTEKKYGEVLKVTRQRTCLEDCGWEWVLTDDVSGTRYKPDEIVAWMTLPKGFKEGK